MKKVEKPAALLSASGSAPSIDESALAAEEKRQVMRCESAAHCVTFALRSHTALCSGWMVGRCRLALARRLKSDMLAEEEKRRYRSREAEVSDRSIPKYSSAAQLSSARYSAHTQCHRSRRARAVPWHASIRLELRCASARAQVHACTSVVLFLASVRALRSHVHGQSRPHRDTVRSNVIRSTSKLLSGGECGLTRRSGSEPKLRGHADDVD